MDDKGFGWVESGGRRWFVHFKDFDRRGRRPTSGEEVRFLPGLDPKGRPCAMRVTFVKPEKNRAGLGAWSLVFLLLVLPLAALLKLPIPWWRVVGGFLLISAATYLMYAVDKKCAISNRWRVPESYLHLAELLGGWPGALLAQRGLRHKCSKPVYQLIFWTIVLGYQAAALDVLMDQRFSRALMDVLRS